MHLLQRSSVSGGDGGRPLRRVGSSPRAPPPTRLTLSRSESIKKKSGGAKRSKRARLRAGLAAALQELRLAGRKHGAAGGRGPAGAARTRAGDVQRGGGGAACSAAAGTAADAAPVPVAAAVAHASRGVGVAGGGWPLLLVVAVLALACVVALGRAPAVCCCTCAAWLYRGASAATDAGRRRSAEVCGRAELSQARPGGGSSGDSAGRPR